MAERFYLRPSTRTPPITPAFDAAWDVTAQADRVWVDREPKGNNTQTANRDETSAVAVNVLARQFTIGPFGAHTYPVTDTFNGQLRAAQIGAAADFNAQVVIRVFSAGNSSEGTLIAADNSALSSEFATTVTGATNRRFPKAGTVNIGTQVVASEGHYLVVEIGARAHNGTATTRQAQFTFFDQYDTADLPNDETTQTSLRSWIEYSGTIPAVASLGPYETELRSKAALRSYWPSEAVDTGLIRDTQQRWPMTAAGSPTPITGPTPVLTGALRFDGTDDSANILIEPTASVGTLIVWLSTPSLNQTDHDEAGFNTAGVSRIRCGAFTQEDVAGTDFWAFHYGDDIDVTHDLVGDAITVDQWEFLAATVAADGIRFYQVDAGTVTLKASDLTPNITAFDWQVFRFAQGRAAVLFGQWDIAHASAHDSVLSITDLQDVYDSAQSGVEIAVGQAVEVEAATAITAVKPIAVAVGQATEAELGQPIEAVKPVLVDVGQAAEQELAQPVSALKPILVDVLPAAEQELGRPISPVGANQVQIGQATEAEAAQPFTIIRSVPIGQAVETELGQAVDAVLNRQVQVGQATEIELGQAITPTQAIFVTVGQAVEVELGGSITIAGTRLGSAVCDLVWPQVSCSIRP